MPSPFDDRIDVNLRAPILLTLRALPHLIASGRGAVVNVASLAGKVPTIASSSRCAWAQVPAICAIGQRRTGSAIVCATAASLIERLAHRLSVAPRPDQLGRELQADRGAGVERPQRGARRG